MAGVSGQGIAIVAPEEIGYRCGLWRGSGGPLRDPPQSEDQSLNITILGGAGFLGRKLAARLAQDGRLGGRSIAGLTLMDLAAPPTPDAGCPVTAIAGDIVDLPPDAIPPGTDVIFHLAAVVSAQAEADYDLGRRVNLRGTDAVVDACRRLVAAGGSPPRVVFTSSVASFSGGQDANPAATMRVSFRPTPMAHKRPRRN